MIIQKVHNISYLAVRSLDVKAYKPKDTIAAVALPAKAEVVSINVEVTEPSEAITADLFIGNEKIANDIDLATKGNKSVNFTHTMGDTTTIDVKLSAASTKGQFKVRVLYFLPSQIQTEY
ncbi:hypothetical protein [Helicobacter sp.]|uniref:hypothetical protein n=1 Tax=Helicobacter sp. TaxID=218 RepID=UPI002A749542|nr:hypothetical protein [Helicobacter sp.]MDY2585463.1 hypothetical protein [Helicobacter sp.]